MNTKYKPQFVEVSEKLINPRQSGAENVWATDIVQEIKEKELATDRKARLWEEDRKKEWRANKSYYMKSRQKEDPAKKIMDDIANGGKFKSIIPAPNLILVRVDREEKTEAGIILPTEAKAPNTGIIIEASDQAFLPSGDLCSMPYTKGNRVLFRKYSGMEVEINGEKLLMLTLQDILAQVEV